MYMSNLPSIGSYPFLAEPFHCDCFKRLFIGHLGNHLLNAADYHSSERGYGMNYLNTINATWVLSRLAIELGEVPLMYDKFNVETWVESVMRYFTNRNFKILGSNGKVYGYGSSIWAMINTESRQPVDILDVKDGAINNCVEKEYVCPIASCSRVRIGTDIPLVQTIDTTYHDVDVNGHINSIKYIEHALNLWSLDWHKQHFVKRIEVAYVAETYIGDKLNFYKMESSNATCTEALIRITKTNIDGEAEVCRIKIVFNQKIE